MRTTAKHENVGFTWGEQTYHNEKMDRALRIMLNTCSSGQSFGTHWECEQTCSLASSTSRGVSNLHPMCFNICRVVGRYLSVFAHPSWIADTMSSTVIGPIRIMIKLGKDRPVRCSSITESTGGNVAKLPVTSGCSARYIPG